MAILLMLSMYVVFTSLQATGIFDTPPVQTVQKQASTTLKSHVASTPNVDNNVTKIKKEVVKKPIYKAPASTPKSKRLFLDNTITAIKKVKRRLDSEYTTVYAFSLKDTLSSEETKILQTLKARYKKMETKELLQRLKTHPISIVVAQATLETGWGSSRFYREANNIFGIWSFNKNEPRMAAGVQREGKKTIYVKKYPNLEASIEGYFRMVARGRAYRELRKARLRTDNPFEIIPYLDHYSELRHEYVKRLYYTMKSNKFYELDNPSYQPPGWSNIKVADPKYLLKTDLNITKTTHETNTTILEENSSKASDINLTIDLNSSLSNDTNLSNFSTEGNQTNTGTTAALDVNQTQENNQTLDINTTLNLANEHNSTSTIAPNVTDINNDKNSSKINETNKETLEKASLREINASL